MSPSLFSVYMADMPKPTDPLPRGNNCVPDGQFFFDFRPKVFRHVAHPRPLLIIQQAQPVCSRESIRHEHNPSSLDMYILGRTEENTTDDLQGSRSSNLHDTNYGKIQHTQNEATGYDKMASIDHLHTEVDMLKVGEHSELLSAKYLDRFLEPGNVCRPFTTRAPT